MVGGEKKERSRSEPPMDGWRLHHRVAKQLLTSIITSPPQKRSTALEIQFHSFPLIQTRQGSVILRKSLILKIISVNL